jgi:hypothetical protein
MRRNICIALLAAMVVLAAADSSAQLGEVQEQSYLRIPHHFTIFAGAGIGVPTKPGPFRSSWNTGFPAEAGIGYSMFAWMDLNFVASYAKFSVNQMEAKREIGFVGVSEIVGGDITTIRYLGTIRFIAVPSHRFNPYAELGLGYFNTSADDLTISGSEPNDPTEQSWTNTMDAVSGLSVNVTVGSQYVLNDSWSTYVKFTWTVNQNSGFAPSNLLLDENDARSDGDGSQHLAALMVGLMIRL